MATDVVQFREDSQRLEYLRQRGINPNEFGRQAFEAALRRMKAEETIDLVEGKISRLPKPIVELVREGRENH